MKSSPSDERIKKIVPANLRELLTKKSIAQIDIIKETNIPPSTIHSYFNGKSLPSPGNLQKIADYLGVSKSEIDPRYSANTLDATQMSRIDIKDLNKIKTKVLYDGCALTQKEIQKIIDFAEMVHFSALYKNIYDEEKS